MNFIKIKDAMINFDELETVYRKVNLICVKVKSSIHIMQIRYSDSKVAQEEFEKLTKQIEDLQKPLPPVKG